MDITGIANVEYNLTYSIICICHALDWSVPNANDIQCYGRALLKDYVNESPKLLIENRLNVFQKYKDKREIESLSNKDNDIIPTGFVDNGDGCYSRDSNNTSDGLKIDSNEELFESSVEDDLSNQNLKVDNSTNKGRKRKGSPILSNDNDHKSKKRKLNVSQINEDIIEDKGSEENEAKKQDEDTKMDDEEKINRSEEKSSKKNK